jgi:flagellar basal-body rod protein FlgF
MSDAVSAATAAMLADGERLRYISQNIANVSTAGYRAEQPLWTGAGSFESLLVGDLASELQASTALLRDRRPGPMSQTGRGLDLAIEGDGYFEVATAAGPRYTRRGDFHLDASGRLVTAAGASVQGSGGDIILPGTDFTIDASGRIHKDDTVLGQIALVAFDDDRALVHEADGLYRGDAEQLRADFVNPAITHLRQGFLEMSNVQPMDETVRMIETVRHFGLSAQALRAYDQMLGTAISEMGNFQ